MAKKKKEGGTEILQLNHPDVQKMMMEPDAFTNCPKDPKFSYAKLKLCQDCDQFFGMCRSDPKLETSALRVVCAHPVMRRITSLKV